MMTLDGCLYQILCQFISDVEAFYKISENFDLQVALEENSGIPSH